MEQSGKRQCMTQPIDEEVESFFKEKSKFFLSEFPEINPIWNKDLPSFGILEVKVYYKDSPYHIAVVTAKREYTAEYFHESNFPILLPVTKEMTITEIKKSLQEFLDNLAVDDRLVIQRNTLDSSFGPFSVDFQNCSVDFAMSANKEFKGLVAIVEVKKE